MRHKTATMGQAKTVIYNDKQWEMLSNIRKKASGVMSALQNARLDSLLYGSAARGDVNPASDIDIMIPQVVRSFKVELALDSFYISGRKLVQATPGSLIKAHIYLSDNIMVTFPMIQPFIRELDFYAFGGQLGTDRLGDIINNRVPGVDKRLILIEPIPEGHIEIPMSDIPPGTVARKLGVGQNIVNERIRVLNRRSKVGITGVYLNHPLAPDEAFEVVLEKIATSDSLVRRQVKKR
jgi:predicted nucleotidyltransferase